MVLLVIISLICSLVASPAIALDNAPKPFMGINHEITKEIPAVKGAGSVKSGIRLTSVQRNTPADEAGMLAGDIIIGIDGKLFTMHPDSVQNRFRDWLYVHAPGEVMTARVARLEVKQSVKIDKSSGDAEAYLKNPNEYLRENVQPGQSFDFQLKTQWVVINIPITLGERHEAILPPLPPLAETDLGDRILPAIDQPLVFWQPWVDEVVERWGIVEPYNDLRERLQSLQAGDDGSRLPAIAETHRNPFFLERYGRRFTDGIINQRGYHAENLFADDDIAVFLTGNLWHGEASQSGKLKTFTLSDAGVKQVSEADFLSWFNGEMMRLTMLWEAVYEPLSAEDKTFILQHKFDLTDAFSQGIYLQYDEDEERFIRNQHLLELGLLIDLDKMFHAASQTATFLTQSEDRVFNWMKSHPEVRSLDTQWGKIGFGTNRTDRWDNPDFRFIFDPDGDDFYANTAGASVSFDQPIAWVVDRSGDDAYQATENGALACGIPGMGVIVDHNGDDTYIGKQWALGAGYMGVGVIRDDDGDDVYRGDEYTQGAALFGLGALIDIAGDDQYHAAIYSQAFGLTHGLGLLVDYDGDDQGYCGGKAPTNYGTAGIFDAWSQGCGVGFRGFASGGVGVLVDVKGADKWEAGNFSQGGGYYFGLGIFRGGIGDDLYIGSRYGQSFSAHQAAGLFIEDGGDDRYTTRHCVVSGLAWDQCVSVFIDEKGDDEYNGGTGFSLGASAHNAFCFFLDRAGKDRYIYNAGPARAGGNDYHGGSSFSLFVDAGKDADYYSSDRVRNDAELGWKEYGIFRDGKGVVTSTVIE